MPRIRQVNGSQHHPDISTPEAMYALIYKVCGQFANDCSNEFEFKEALDVFVNEDLKVPDTRRCFMYVGKRLERLSIEQIRRECSSITETLGRNDESAWQAMVDLELDQLIRGVA